MFLSFILSAYTLTTLFFTCVGFTSRAEVRSAEQEKSEQGSGDAAGVHDSRGEKIPDSADPFPELGVFVPDLKGISGPLPSRVDGQLVDLCTAKAKAVYTL